MSHTNVHPIAHSLAPICQPSHTSRNNAAPEQCFARTDDDGASLRTNGDDVHRFRESAR
ncbi:hypothetical protein D3C83_308710 [compost metagenome]